MPIAVAKADVTRWEAKGENTSLQMYMLPAVVYGEA